MLPQIFPLPWIFIFFILFFSYYSVSLFTSFSYFSYSSASCVFLKPMNQILPW